MKTVTSLDNGYSVYANNSTPTLYAPFRWLSKGWQDFRRAPSHSLAYGVVFATVGWLLVSIYQSNASYLLPGLFFFMLFVGPLLAFGLYDISQQLERNHEPSFTHERKKAFSEMGHELMLSLMMALVFMLMIMFTSLVMNILAAPWETGISAPLPMSGSVFFFVTVVFAGLLFCVNLFALPLIVDQDANAGAAMATSLDTVWRNKSVIAIWALLVLALMALGFATYLLGFVVIVPVLGFASWHAYREMIIVEKST